MFLGTEEMNRVLEPFLIYRIKSVEAKVFAFRNLQIPENINSTSISLWIYCALGNKDVLCQNSFANSYRQV